MQALKSILKLTTAIAAVAALSFGTDAFAGQPMSGANNLPTQQGGENRTYILENQNHNNGQAAGTERTDFGGFANGKSGQGGQGGSMSPVQDLQDYMSNVGDNQMPWVHNSFPGGMNNSSQASNAKMGGSVSWSGLHSTGGGGAAYGSLGGVQDAVDNDGGATDGPPSMEPGAKPDRAPIMEQIINKAHQLLKDVPKQKSTNAHDTAANTLAGLTQNKIENTPGQKANQAKANQNAQKEQGADNLAAMERYHASAAIEFCRSFVNNFTTDGGNKWNQIRNKLFIPMALLLLLPGAVLSQVKSIVSQGFSVLGEISPFEGIQRAMIAIFLIPATYLVVNYGIDLANSITKSIADSYQMVFGTDMYEDAFCGHVRAFPIREPEENPGMIVNMQTVMFNYFGNTPLARLEGKTLAIKYDDPCAGIYIVPPDRADDVVPYLVNEERMAFNQINAAFACAWTILCAVQEAYLYYLWFVGPVMAALWVYPSKQLRDALPSWIEGVLSVCFWSMFWNTTIMLMACFRGVDDTGTIMFTALNFLAVGSVKFAFDFSGLVKDAGANAVRAGEKVAQAAAAAQSKAAGGGSGGGGGGGCGGGGGGGGGAQSGQHGGQGGQGAEGTPGPNAPMHSSSPAMLASRGPELGAPSSDGHGRTGGGLEGTRSEGVTSPRVEHSHPPMSHQDHTRGITLAAHVPTHGANGVSPSSSEGGNSSSSGGSSDDSDSPNNTTVSDSSNSCPADVSMPPLSTAALFTQLPQDPAKSADLGSTVPPPPSQGGYSSDSLRNDGNLAGAEKAALNQVSPDQQEAAKAMQQTHRNELEAAMHQMMQERQQQHQAEARQQMEQAQQQKLAELSQKQAEQFNGSFMQNASPEAQAAANQAQAERAQQLAQALTQQQDNDRAKESASSVCVADIDHNYDNSSSTSTSLNVDMGGDVSTIDNPTGKSSANDVCTIDNPTGSATPSANFDISKLAADPTAMAMPLTSAPNTQAGVCTVADPQGTGTASTALPRESSQIVGAAMQHIADQATGVDGKTGRPHDEAHARNMESQRHADLLGGVHLGSSKGGDSLQRTSLEHTSASEVPSSKAQAPGVCTPDNPTGASNHPKESAGSMLGNAAYANFQKNDEWFLKTADQIGRDSVGGQTTNPYEQVTGQVLGTGNGGASGFGDVSRYASGAADAVNNGQIAPIAAETKSISTPGSAAAAESTSTTPANLSTGSNTAESLKRESNSNALVQATMQEMAERATGIDSKTGRPHDEAHAQAMEGRRHADLATGIHMQAAHGEASALPHGSGHAGNTGTAGGHLPTAHPANAHAAEHTAAAPAVQQPAHSAPAAPDVAQAARGTVAHSKESAAEMFGNASFANMQKNEEWFLKTADQVGRDSVGSQTTNPYEQVTGQVLGTTNGGSSSIGEQAPQTGRYSLSAGEAASNGNAAPLSGSGSSSDTGNASVPTSSLATGTGSSNNVSSTSTNATADSTLKRDSNPLVEATMNQMADDITRIDGKTGRPLDEAHAQAMEGRRHIELSTGTQLHAAAGSHASQSAHAITGHADHAQAAHGSHSAGNTGHAGSSSQHHVDGAHAAPPTSGPAAAPLSGHSAAPAGGSSTSTSGNAIAAEAHNAPGQQNAATASAASHGKASASELLGNAAFKNMQKNDEWFLKTADQIGRDSVGSQTTNPYEQVTGIVLGTTNGGTSIGSASSDSSTAGSVSNANSNAIDTGSSTFASSSSIANAGGSSSNAGNSASPTEASSRSSSLEKAAAGSSAPVSTGNGAPTSILQSALGSAALEPTFKRESNPIVDSTMKEMANDITRIDGKTGRPLDEAHAQAMEGRRHVDVATGIQMHSGTATGSNAAAHSSGAAGTAHGTSGIGQSHGGAPVSANQHATGSTVNGSAQHSASTSNGSSASNAGSNAGSNASPSSSSAADQSVLARGTSSSPDVSALTGSGLGGPAAAQSKESAGQVLGNAAADRFKKNEEWFLQTADKIGRDSVAAPVTNLYERLTGTVMSAGSGSSITSTTGSDTSNDSSTTTVGSLSSPSSPSIMPATPAGSVSNSSESTITNNSQSAANAVSQSASTAASTHSHTGSASSSHATSATHAAAARSQSELKRDADPLLAATMSELADKLTGIDKTTGRPTDGSAALIEGQRHVELSTGVQSVAQNANGQAQAGQVAGHASVHLERQSAAAAEQNSIARPAESTHADSEQRQAVQSTSAEAERRGHSELTQPQREQHAQMESTNSAGHRLLADANGERIVERADNSSVLGKEAYDRMRSNEEWFLKTGEKQGRDAANYGTPAASHGKDGVAGVNGNNGTMPEAILHTPSSQARGAHADNARFLAGAETAKYLSEMPKVAANSANRPVVVPTAQVRSYLIDRLDKNGRARGGAKAGMKSGGALARNLGDKRSSAGVGAPPVSASAPTTTTKSETIADWTAHLSAENLRRRYRKAGKKSAQQAAQESQALANILNAAKQDGWKF